MEEIYSDKYIVAEELDDIRKALEATQHLWDLMTASFGSLSFESSNFELQVFDGSELLGKITWSESGPAFYPVVAE